MRSATFALLALILTGCPKKDGTDNAGSTGSTSGSTAVTTGVDGVVAPAVTAPETLEERLDVAIKLLDKGDANSARLAIPELESLAKSDKDVPEVHYNLGVARLLSGDTTGARKAFMAATDLDPTLGDAWLNLGALAEREGDLDRALANYRSGLRYQADHPDLIVGVISALRKLGRNDEAIREAKAALIKNANNVNAYNNLGLVYVDQGNLDLALFLYQKALNEIEGADENALLHCNLGQVYLLLERPNSARRELERSIELDPKLVVALLFLSEYYLDNHDWNGAFALLETALAVEPENPAVHINLGITYRGLQRYDEAKASYEKALALDPNNPDPYLNLAVLYGDYLKSYDVALGSIQTYRDRGGRNFELASAWEEDIAVQKQKYELALERENRRLEREKRLEEQKRLAEEHERNQQRWEEENAQQPEPTPDGTTPEGASPEGASPEGASPEGAESAGETPWGETPQETGTEPAPTPSEGEGNPQPLEPGSDSPSEGQDEGETPWGQNP